MVAYPLGISESIRTIFSGVLIGAIKKDNPLVKEKISVSKICRARFMANFPSNVFKDE